MMRPGRTGGVAVPTTSTPLTPHSWGEIKKNWGTPPNLGRDDSLHSLSTAPQTPGRRFLLHLRVDFVSVRSET